MVSHDGQCAFEEIKHLLRPLGRKSAKPQALNSGALIGNSTDSSREQAMGFSMMFAWIVHFRRACVRGRGVLLNPLVYSTVPKVH